MIDKLNGIDSADVAIQATIDSINALNFLFGIANARPHGLVYNNQVQCKGLGDSNRGFLESRRALWTLNRPFLASLNFRLCSSKVFDRGIKGPVKVVRFSVGPKTHLYFKKNFMDSQT